jgi:nucleotide-binding universal stress UspA family protein
MLKSFLVTVDGSEYSSGAVGYAIALGRKEKARLSLLYVVNITNLEGPFLADLGGSIGVTPFLDFQNQVRRVLEEKASLILAHHASVCREAGLECSTKVETGIISRAICQEALKHDAVVIGRRGEHASWRGYLLGSVVEDVVHSCSKPVLVTPREVRPVTKILAAYDGSRVANRALGVAAAAARDLGLPLVVACVNSDTRAGRGILDEAEAYLKPHHLEVKSLLESGSAVDGILRAADQEHCDLIIMGAYGHSRVRELLLGSTTEEILRRAAVPLLLYR